MLIQNEERKEKTEICSKCKSPLNNTDYIYRLRTPEVKTYLCSKCGYFEIYLQE